MCDCIYEPYSIHIHWRHYSAAFNMTLPYNKVPLVSHINSLWMSFLKKIFETVLSLKKSCRFNTVYIPLMQLVSLHVSISLYYGTFVRAKKPVQVQCYYLNSRFHWIFTSFSTNDLFLLEDPIHNITLHLGLDEFLKEDNFISSLPLEWYCSKVLRT